MDGAVACLSPERIAALVRAEGREENSKTEFFKAEKECLEHFLISTFSREPFYIFSQPFLSGSTFNS